MLTQRIGGSFAPPLTDATLAAYRALIDQQPPQTRLRDALDTLYRCAAAWWEQPESVGAGSPHPSGRGQIVPLDGDIALALWDTTPWMEELDAMRPLFDALDPLRQKALRDCAFHLLWHAIELTRDREPITNDKI